MRSLFIAGRRRGARPSTAGQRRDDAVPVWQGAVVGRLRDGDPEALAELYDQFGDRVYGWAMRMTGSRPDAEQVTAAVFTACWRDPHTLPADVVPLTPRLASLTWEQARVRPAGRTRDDAHAADLRTAGTPGPR